LVNRNSVLKIISDVFLRSFDRFVRVIGLVVEDNKLRLTVAVSVYRKDFSSQNRRFRSV
jgi:hypothetical protein